MNIEEFRENIIEYTKRIRSHLDNALSGIADKYGLTHMQMRILLKIYKDGSHTITSLANAIGAFGANISPLCKKLERDGLVIRKRNADDERVVTLELTNNGRKVAEELDQYFNNMFSTMMEKLDEESLTLIIKGMKKLSDVLETSNLEKL